MSLARLVVIEGPDAGREFEHTVKDDRTIPDTMAVLFEMPSGAIYHFDVNESSAALRPKYGEVMLCGTKGTLCVNESGYQISPTKPGQFQKWDAAFEEETFELTSKEVYGDLATKEDTTRNLINNFLECVQSRKDPNAPVEAGQATNIVLALALDSLRSGKRIQYKP
jgi:predicted dehydrogenase